MKHYLITLIFGDERIERNIVAHDSLKATLIGIKLFPKTEAPLAIICKPVLTP